MVDDTPSEDIQDNNPEDTDADEDDDEVVKAIKAEKNKPRDHPPSISCDDFIVDISFHPDKNIIALANIVGDVLLYEYNNEETKLIETHELHLKACRAVEFDENGRTMYTASKVKEKDNCSRCTHYKTVHCAQLHIMQWTEREL